MRSATSLSPDRAKRMSTSSPRSRFSGRYVSPSYSTTGAIVVVHGALPALSLEVVPRGVVGLDDDPARRLVDLDDLAAQICAAIRRVVTGAAEDVTNTAAAAGDEAQRQNGSGEEGKRASLVAWLLSWPGRGLSVSPASEGSTARAKRHASGDVRARRWRFRDRRRCPGERDPFGRRVERIGAVGVPFDHRALTTQRLVRRADSTYLPLRARIVADLTDDVERLARADQLDGVVTVVERRCAGGRVAERKGTRTDSVVTHDVDIPAGHGAAQRDRGARREGATEVHADLAAIEAHGAARGIDDLESLVARAALDVLAEEQRARRRHLPGVRGGVPVGAAVAGIAVRERSAAVAAERVREVVLARARYRQNVLVLVVVRRHHVVPPGIGRRLAPDPARVHRGIGAVRPVAQVGADLESDIVAGRLIGQPGDVELAVDRYLGTLGLRDRGGELQATEVDRARHLAGELLAGIEGRPGGQRAALESVDEQLLRRGAGGRRERRDPDRGQHRREGLPRNRPIAGARAPARLHTGGHPTPSETSPPVERRWRPAGLGHADTQWLPPSEHDATEFPRTSRTTLTRGARADRERRPRPRCRAPADAPRPIASAPESWTNRIRSGGACERATTVVRLGLRETVASDPRHVRVGLPEPPKSVVPPSTGQRAPVRRFRCSESPLVRVRPALGPDGNPRKDRRK